MTVGAEGERQERAREKANQPPPEGGEAMSHKLPSPQRSQGTSQQKLVRMIQALLLPRWISM
jgi:hypothetical protein